MDNYQLFEIVEELDEDKTIENRNQLINIIKKLDDSEIEMVELRYFEKRSFKEIGEILNITENNAKAHRVIKKMKKIYFKS